MFAKLNSGVFGIALVLTLCPNASASSNDGVSYYSLKQQLKHGFPPSIPVPKCDEETRVQLMEDFDQNTRDIFDRIKSLDELIKNCKKIFFSANDASLPLYEEYEDEAPNVGNIIDIIQISEGLPEAALRLQALYEQRDEFDKSLLWGMVACYLGFQSAPESVARLLARKNNV